MTERKPRSMLKQSQVIELYGLLKQRCSAVDGFAVYEGGWDDARLAKEFGCTVANVANLRVSMIGRFRPRVDVSAAGRIDALEQAVAALQVEAEGLKGMSAQLGRRLARLEDRE